MKLSHVSCGSHWNGVKAFGTKQDVLLGYAEKLLASTGYEEISLASLSTSDYKDLEPFANELVELCEKE
ncbi:hypothetical protein, partial [Zhenhengia yiwuensis]|uniref:hypothetical protein n=1 Tax=Zhenhengia yiwuensis TaxID=2763666 RepID=UPI002A750785